MHFNLAFRSFLVASFFILSACAPGKSDDQDYKVNGKPAAEYYQQFVSKPDLELCQGGVDQAPQTYLEAESNSFGLRNLILSSDSRFTFNSTSSSISDASGKWSVQKTFLIIGGLARGTGVIYNEQPGVILEFSQSPSVSAELRGKKVMFLKVDGQHKCPDIATW